ncbi:MAG: sugar ABC transporter ATP-binding protein [Deltaproteobacteria bacterium]|jgi:simple sugar transport system ATP-binding protein|nr:sugar ABC transporter ATP-binding protein [Deltaproteobacteria bacterium]
MAVYDDDALLAVRGLSKEFPGVKALSEVDFTLRSGEIHALLGENGAGKSTLIKCISGVYKRDGGAVFIEGQSISPASVEEAQRLRIGVVYQEVNLLGNRSVAENLFLGRQPTRFGLVDVKTMRRKAREILKRYNLDIDVSENLARFSVAVQQIVAIARAVDLSAKVLILDEPTASLDRHETAMVFDVMRVLRDKGIGIIFITHFLDQVFEITDRITVLRNGCLVGERKTAELTRLELVSMMLGRELDDKAQRIKTRRRELEGEPVVSFQSLGKRGVVSPFSFEVRGGEILGVAGLLGAGRTETAKTIFGITPADFGEVTAGGKKVNVKSPVDAVKHDFGYCPEDRKVEGIIGDLSIRENIILALQAKKGWLKPITKGEQEKLADYYIDRLKIRPADREKPIELLSGGNQQKALLARWLATNPRFLILDEPTRGIDVGAHAEIIKLIEELCVDGLALLVISSELEEIVSYATRVSVMRDRKHIRELTGSEVTVGHIMKAIASDGAEVEHETVA